MDPRLTPEEGVVGSRDAEKPPGLSKYDVLRVTGDGLSGRPANDSPAELDAKGE